MRRYPSGQTTADVAKKVISTSDVGSKGYGLGYSEETVWLSAFKGSKLVVSDEM